MCVCEGLWVLVPVARGTTLIWMLGVMCVPHCTGVELGAWVGAPTQRHSRTVGCQENVRAPSVSLGLI